MTLTTERLKWLHDAATELSATKLKMTMRPDELLVLTSELLANREAQPVIKPFGYYSEETAALLGRRGFAPISADPLVDHNKPLFTAPPAPAVNAAPDFEAWFNSPEAGLRTVNFHIQHELQLKAWNACRAAMLDQPVSGGYKLVPAEPTEDMIAAAMNCDDVTFNADETFCVNFGNIYAAMLAAAPEGGNDHDTRR
ncbi:hypothetical protein [Serratia marcescens]|uniref:hypothetical protein n=1 Tax=Serratia marcescens TaxID=615 RepID=UPI001660C1C3|nr:hypothetical protein [Serratia marcescens]HEI9922968.1 hypothetical protein [Serratia marcescens]